MGKKLHILCVLGTRPEAIKMAPVILELRRHPRLFQTTVCLSRQHQRMLDQALQPFGIRGDHDLQVMQDNQSLASLSARPTQGLDDLCAELKPDWVLAQGDTTTVMVAALVCFYRRIPFGHIEAGLRTGCLDNPFPEEANRRIADLLSGWLFAPTPRARDHLLREGVSRQRGLVTGNTVVDALKLVSRQPCDRAGSPLRDLPEGRRLVAVTLHRRESFGAPLRGMCGAIRTLARRSRALNTQFVLPVHLNPNVRGVVHELLGGEPNVSLVEPLDYRSFVWLLQHAILALTDSGGVQEEAPSFGVPVLVLRETTERPEAVEAGVARLLGTSPARIVREAMALLRNEPARLAMARGAHPFGDGHAAERIVQALAGQPVAAWTPRRSRVRKGIR